LQPLNQVFQNSNIVEFFSMLKKDDREHQMVYYQVTNFLLDLQISLLKHAQAGIGTYTNPEIATPMMAKLSKVRLSELWQLCVPNFPLQLLDEAIAWNLDAHVMGTFSINFPIYVSVIG
jgi:hypothetical protein